MAESDRPLSPGLTADRRGKLASGLAGLGFLALFVAGPFAALLGFAGAFPDVPALARDGYLQGVVLFTLQQALLSAALSVAGAVPLAIALHRFRFPGRALVLRLFLLPQALPVLVGALGIIAVWGRGGVVSDGLAALGQPRLDVYGLSGILLAHVFFNLPLAARLIFAALDSVPAESWKLAGQLSLGPMAVFRLVEWPAVRAALPGAASLVFMLCITSFTLVLVLGGGPSGTTLEVAIFQSLRYDFDPGRAVLLALVQITLTGLVLAAVLRLGGHLDAGVTLGRKAVRFDRQTALQRAAGLLVILLGLGFIAAPFIAVLVKGLGADLFRLAGEPLLQRALATSLAIGFAAATLSLVLSLALLFGASSLTPEKGPLRSLRGVFDLSGSLVLVIPPIVLGAGWFLVLRRATDVFALAPVMVVLTNAVMAMPFVMRIAGPALASSAARHDRLAASLAMTGWSRWRYVEWPAVRGALGLGFAFALALSLGDLGVAALFGNQDFVTLPLLLHQRMGSYRSTDAAGIALILGALSLALMAIAERGFRKST